MVNGAEPNPDGHCGPLAGENHGDRANLEPRIVGRPAIRENGLRASANRLIRNVRADDELPRRSLRTWNWPGIRQLECTLKDAPRGGRRLRPSISRLRTCRVVEPRRIDRAAQCADWCVTRGIGNQRPVWNCDADIEIIVRSRHRL